MTTTDLIIIGSGPGGYRAADYAAKKSLKVVVVEDGHAGGTCLNSGCIPTKAFCHDAALADILRHGEDHGLADVSFTVDFQKVASRKDRIVEQLRSGVEALLAQPGITLVRGRARLTSGKTVVVEGEEYSAPNIIIATGSRPKLLPVPGMDSPAVVTSEGMLQATSVPKRLCIIGAGVVGMEFASAFAAFGSEVIVVEYLKECLPALDADISKRLRKAMEKRGVKFHLGAGVKAVEGNTVVFEKKGKEERVEADTILVATGRASNVEDLGLEEAGVEFTPKGIAVDENMRTNVPGVYAIGDVNGRQMLAHAATFQGFRAVNAILGLEDGIRFDVMPAAVFTTPEAASVGPTEAACKELGMEYSVRKGYYRSNGKALAEGVEDGMVKLIVGEEGKIVACHAYGAHAADIVQEATAMISLGATLEQLHSTIHTHPTLGEVLHEIS